MTRFLVVSLVVFLSACAKAPPKNDGLGKEETAQEMTFDRGLRALEKEDYVQASKIFESLLVAKPATEFDLVTLYNAGAAYEGLGNCTKASERYRAVVRASGGKFERVDAQALFRLSLMYECLGQDAKAVTSLLDARKRGKTLPFETLHAEIPARLAAAYSRIGNRGKAVEYFSIASQGLKKIVTKEKGLKQTETLGRTLFMMGQLSPTQRSASVSPESFFQSLSMQQPYLLQAVELNHPVWSKRASDDLKIGYDNLWKFNIEEPEKKRAFYMRGMQAAQELKKIRFPGGTGMVEEVFDFVEKSENKLQTELGKLAVTTKPTAEAERREALKQKGKLVDPPKAKAVKKQ